MKNYTIIYNISIYTIESITFNIHRDIFYIQSLLYWLEFFDIFDTIFIIGSTSLER